jgi:chemotaxis protein CheZ
MTEPRKIFRIEETAAARLGLASGLEDTQAALRHAEIMRELKALRALLGAAAPSEPADKPKPHDAEAERLTSELHLIYDALSGAKGAAANPDKGALQLAPINRIAHELDAVVTGTEQATQKVLAAAEQIDQVANNLSAALKGKIEQGLAQDIQDLVIRIFEACNFQDLAGQRVAKVLATLRYVEAHITRVLEELKNGPAPRHDGSQQLHGPRLETDRGHVSQNDIDAMFV